MTPATERVARRLVLATAVGVVSGLLAFQGQALVVHNTDFTQIWHATRGWLGGRNPYDVVGPQGSFYWPFPLLYPGTALLATLPLAMLPLRAANWLFVALGSAALAWALSRDHRKYAGVWFLFASASYAYVIRTAQWSPWLMASAISPSLGWLLACKPSVGLALFVAYPGRRTAIGVAAFTLVSVALLPVWPREWLAALPSAYHMSAPVTYVSAGGPLILLALLRWRLPEARLLVALGCIPHTTMLYESLPLFLIASRWYEGLVLAALSWVCFALPESRDYLQRMHETAWRMTLLLYLPCVVMVLFRRNIDTSARWRRDGGDDGATPAAVR